VYLFVDYFKIHFVIILRSLWAERRVTVGLKNQVDSSPSSGGGILPFFKYILGKTMIY
jgi:hypothetical protein